MTWADWTIVLVVTLLGVISGNWWLIRLIGLVT